MTVFCKINKAIVLVLLLLFIISTLIATSRLAEKIPVAVKKRLDELKLKVLDDEYTLNDLAFHRFFRSDYIGELKKINAAINDRVLTKYLVQRRNLLIYLILTFMAVSAVVILYFYSTTNSD